MTLEDPEAVLAFALRGGCVMTAENHSSFNYGVEIGRGLWLNLTEEQYRKLKSNSRTL